MSTTTTPAPAPAVAAYVAALTSDTPADAVAIYVAASSGDKARMRVAHQATVTDAMTKIDFDGDVPAQTARVQRMIAVATDQSAAVATKAPAPVDHDVAVAVFVAACSLAGATAAGRYEGDNDGVTIDVDRVAALVELAFAGTADDVPADVIDLAGTIADRIKVGRRTSAPGRDVAAHVYQALSSAPAGTALTVAQIRATATDECPNGAASDGAISARLFPRDGSACTIAGVVPVMVDGVKGARLA